MPLPPRIEVDNEHSTNTAHSVNSILMSTNKVVENPQQHKLLSTSDLWPSQPQQEQEDHSQLTVGSLNQLTVTSISSEYSSTTNIDEYIHRLLEAGYSSKVSKQLCLKATEVTAICRAAMDIFLSQPVKYFKLE